MSELSLDNDQRDLFACDLNGVGVPQLVGARRRRTLRVPRCVAVVRAQRSRSTAIRSWA